jgi:hypothetical protein
MQISEPPQPSQGPLSPTGEQQQQPNAEFQQNGKGKQYGPPNQPHPNLSPTNDRHEPIVAASRQPSPYCCPHLPLPNGTSAFTR